MTWSVLALISGEWVTKVVLIYIYPMAKDVEHYFRYLTSFVFVCLFVFVCFENFCLVDGKILGEVM